jgi:hypothetical protein
MKGADLVGKRYKRPLDWIAYPAEGNTEVIVGEEFVSAEDGSGVVHMAPAFGADDYAAGKRHDLAFVNPVNARGEFPAEMPLVGGRFVKDADPLIIEELTRRDQLWKAQKFVHSYPHCWRCGTPLLYYARSSWFVRTTAYKDEMLARNAAVDWNPPEVGAGRFGSWLENNIDWAISRDRYWGTPLPVWVNDADPAELEVIGVVRGARGQGGRAAARGFRPAQAAHRPVHLARAQRHGDDAPRERGDRHLVRLGLDAVRAVGLSASGGERREARALLSRGVHRRGRGPDTRMVLFAARDRDRVGRCAAGSGECTVEGGRGARRPSRHPIVRSWSTTSCSTRTGRRCPSRAATRSIRAR